MLKIVHFWLFFALAVGFFMHQYMTESIPNSVL